MNGLDVRLKPRKGQHFRAMGRQTAFIKLKRVALFCRIGGGGLSLPAGEPLLAQLSQA